MPVKADKNIAIRFPDFLVIGAGRSGTTWLYENLKKSEEIWLPPIKEIHYFDRSTQYSSPSFLNEPSLLKRLIGNEDYNVDFRKKFARAMGSVIFKGGLKNLSWFINFYLSNYSDKWYASLFKNGSGKITGDITPAYQILVQKDIRKIYELMPGCKIIFIIRNPVLRTWSQFRKNNQSGFNLDHIKDLIASDDIRLRNDYLATIKNYLSSFPKENFLIAYYDEIIECPDKLINRILNFLGAKNINYSEINQSRINASPSTDLPQDIKEILIHTLMPDVEKIAKEMPNEYTSKWLTELKTG